jgi:hypothetical protein
LLSLKTAWNVWLVLSFGLTAIFACASSHLSSTVYRLTRRILFCLFGLAILFYAVISSGGLFVFGGRVGAFERLFFIAPVISPLVMLTSSFSVRWAAILMWVLFTFVHSYYSWINWPSLFGIVMSLSFDWPLLTTALLLSIIVWQDKRKSGSATIMS